MQLACRAEAAVELEGDCSGVGLLFSPAAHHSARSLFKGRGCIRPLDSSKAVRGHIRPLDSSKAVGVK